MINLARNLPLAVANGLAIDTEKTLGVTTQKSNHPLWIFNGVVKIDKDDINVAKIETVLKEWGLPYSWVVPNDAPERLVTQLENEGLRKIGEPFPVFARDLTPPIKPCRDLNARLQTVEDLSQFEKWTAFIFEHRFFPEEAQKVFSDIYWHRVDHYVIRNYSVIDMDDEKVKATGTLILFDHAAYLCNIIFEKTVFGQFLIQNLIEMVELSDDATVVAATRQKEISFMEELGFKKKLEFQYFAPYFESEIS